MKRAFLVVLLFALALSAQRRGGGMGFRGGNFSRPAAAFYAPGYLSYSPTFLSGPVTLSNGFAGQPPWGWWSPGPPTVIWLAPPVEQKVIYFPTWMRSDLTPLGDIARQVGVGRHKHGPASNKLDLEN